MTDNLEDLSEPPIHRNSYSAKDYFCKFQGICEYYDNSCRYGERSINDCPYAEKIVRAEHRKIERGYKI